MILPTWWPQWVWGGLGWKCHTRRKLHKLLDQQMSEFYIFHYFGLCSTIRFLCISSICFIFSSFKLGLPEAGGGIQQWWESSDSTRCSRGNPKPLKHSRKQYQNPRILLVIERFLWVDSKKVATSGAGPSLSNAKSKVENMSIVIATTITIRPNSRQACILYVYGTNIRIIGIAKTIICQRDCFAWCKV